MHLFDSFNYGGIFYFTLSAMRSCASHALDCFYLNVAYLMVVLVEATKKCESVDVLYGMIWLFEKHQSVDVAYG